MSITVGCKSQFCRRRRRARGVNEYEYEITHFGVAHITVPTPPLSYIIPIPLAILSYTYACVANLRSPAMNYY